MNSAENTGFNRQTVLNFRFFDDLALSALSKELSLSLPPTTLQFCRNHFRMREGRDPMVGELQYIDLLFRLLRKMPGAPVIGSIEGNEEAIRAFRDLCHKDAILAGDSLSVSCNLPRLMGTAGKYMERCGLSAYHTALVCGHSAELAALAAGAPVSLALELDGVSAMLAPSTEKPRPEANILLLLSPTGNAPFAVEVSRFLSQHRHCGLSPLAAPNDEGIFPHLLTLEAGITLDTASLFPTAPDPASLLTVGKNALLLLAPEAVLPQLLSDTPALAVCGRLGSGRWLQIRHGPAVSLSVSMDLLRALRLPRIMTPTLSRLAPQRVAFATATCDTAYLGGVTVTGSCARDLLDLIGTLAAQGADLTRATMTAVLEIPPIRADGQAIAQSLPALLEYHRIAAELSLPTCHHRQLLREHISSPRLSVFVAAERGAARNEGFMQFWEDAAKRQDFALLRTALYSK